MIAPIQFLDNDGLKTLVRLIRNMFATKDELNSFSTSQTVMDEIDQAVSDSIDDKIATGDISRIQASVVDDNDGNVTVEFDSTDSKIQTAVESAIAQRIQSGEIGRLQASITDDDDGNITMTFAS